MLAEVPENIFNMPFMYTGHAHVGGRGKQIVYPIWKMHPSLLSFHLCFLIHITAIRAQQGGKGENCQWHCALGLFFHRCHFVTF